MVTWGVLLAGLWGFRLWNLGLLRPPSVLTQRLGSVLKCRVTQDNQVPMKFRTCDDIAWCPPLCLFSPALASALAVRRAVPLDPISIGAGGGTARFAGARPTPGF